MSGTYITRPDGVIQLFPRRSVACVVCGKAVEAVRECYAIPHCYQCLPPPPPLETMELPASGRDGAAATLHPTRAPSTPSRTRVLTRQQQLPTKGGLDITGEDARPLRAIAELTNACPYAGVTEGEMVFVLQILLDAPLEERIGILTGYGYTLDFALDWLERHAAQ